MNFKDLKIGTKLLAGFLAVALIVIAQGILSYKETKAMSSELFHVQRSATVSDAARLCCMNRKMAKTC